MSSLLPLTSTLFAFPSKLTPKSTTTPFISQRPFKNSRDRTHGFIVSRSVAPDDNENQPILPESQKLIPPNVDRRNLLVGLGGLYTATNFPSLPVAFANPITAPNITSLCTDSKSGFNNLESTTVRTAKCCPLNIGKKIKAFVFPKEKTVRMRWPAHKGSKENVEKYKKAVQAMRALPKDHPHNFNNQAKIHCAYCNGRYSQVENGFPDIEIQIHNSWLFFPFHRWYLYFHERILGKLINDPTFALPYWNWDDPSGMIIPELFVEEDSIDKPNPLFDVYRDAHHLPPTIVDLTFDGTDRETKSDIQIACNLSTVYRDLVRNGGDTRSFFGGKYVAGDAPFATKSSSVGSVEAGSHTGVHKWVGDSKTPNGEDMGSFYSAGYDPLFYAHHANVDRMWKLWKDLGLPGHVEPTNPDWLNASYVFYDENEDLVRIYNKDCINMAKLKYNYEESNPEIPWRTRRPPKHSEKGKLVSRSTGDVIKVEQLDFPVHLDRILRVLVKRPTVNRTKAEKVKANEVLVINGITFDSKKFVKFDVFVGDILEECDVTTPCNPNYAGGFAQLPHPYLDKMSKDMYITSAVRFGLTELLEDNNAESEEYAMVILVPRTGCDDLTLGHIKIELVPIV